MEIKKDIYWVGHVDWNVRDFHGYETGRGSTYNAYLVKDEKVAVVDSVKAPFASQLLKNIAALVKFEDVDYVVCNHAEPDHSGSIPALMAACPNAELVCNAKCQDILSKHYDTAGWNWKIVAEGETLSLGQRTFAFVNTPMAHWPESMVTYVPEEKLLFSMDGFGQHYATSGRFDDEVPFEELMSEAKTYYANIIMLYGNAIQKVLAKASGLEIEMIAPSHGVIWRTHIAKIVEAYDKWSRHVASPKVLIFYDSMWKSTDMMAQAILEGAIQPGVEVKLFDVKSTHITTLAMEIIDAKAIAVGSPTLNKSFMPKIGEALTYLKGLSPEGKCGVAFGSYGWAKKGGQHDVQAYLESMKVEMISAEPIQSQYVPTEEVLEACRASGRELAKRALSVAGQPA
jgi:flavorubredoxin